MRAGSNAPWASHLRTLGAAPAPQDLVRVSVCSAALQNHLPAAVQKCHSFFPLPKAKPAWVSLLAKGARLVFPCAAAGWLQQMQCKEDASKIFPICFLICAVGRALFQGPASPSASSVLYKHWKQREPPSAEPLLCDEDRNKQPVMLKMEGREKSWGKPRDRASLSDRPRSGWLLGCQPRF